jgi:GDP-fucose protein O-fucosyltransferase
VCFFVCKNCLIFHLYLILGDPKQWVVYIATDEKDQTFFESFVKTFKAVYFLSDYTESANFTDLNQNHIGMVEQVICANAHTFIGMSLITLFNLK